MRGPERLPRLLAQSRRRPRPRFARRLAAHGRHRRARRRGLLLDQAAGSRRWSSRAARTSIPAEIEAVLHEHPAGQRRRRRRCARRALGRGLRRIRRPNGAVRPRTSCARTAASGSRASRCRRRSTSSTSCRATRWARFRSRSWFPARLHRGYAGVSPRHDRRRHQRRRAPALEARSRHAPQAARRGRARVRRARLPRRVGRQAGRGRRRRRRAPSTSTSTRRRRSSTSSCATSTAACGTR